MDAILPSPFTCVYIALIAVILAVMLWCMDSAAALKCNGYGLESLLTGYLDQGSVHRRDAQYVTVWGIVHWEGSAQYSVGEQIF